MFEIKGLNKLTKTLDELKKLSKELDGELGKIQFDVDSAESIEQAIVEMEEIVDKKFESYVSNPVASNMANSLKSSYRQMIIDKASESRIEANQEEKSNGN